MSTKKVLTLCIIHQHPQVLLGMKKRGFGAGRWNGFGGKVEPGETIEAAVQRELLEEAGIKLISAMPLGVLEFEFVGNPEILEVHVYKVTEFEGEPIETEEMKPQWFETVDIPFTEMWPDDRYWMPHFLKNRQFKGKFTFDPEGKLLDHELSTMQ